MIQAPWDDHLWALLSSAPEEVTPAIMKETCKENLANRKRFRIQQERTRPTDDPLLLVPPSGQWSGEYQDMPCVANQEHEVTCKITFKADGAVEGCLSCKDDGECKIQGMYDRSTGIVVWSQCPSNPRPGAKATEFYGDVYNLSSGPARVTGTFLTSSGRYCVLNLVNPSGGVSPTMIKDSVKGVSPTLIKDSVKGSEKPSASKNRATSPAVISIAKLARESKNTSPDALPTLLGGNLQPITDGQPIYYKGKKIVSNGGLLLG